MIDWLLGFGVGVLVMTVFWFLILRRGWKERAQTQETYKEIVAQAQEALASAKKVHEDVMAQAEKIRDIMAQAEKLREAMMEASK